MYKFEKNEVFKKRFFAFTDLAVIEVSFLIAWIFGVWTYEPFVILQIFTAFASMSVVLMTEAYKNIYVRGWWQEFKKVVTSVSVTYLLMIAYLFIIEGFKSEIKIPILCMYAFTLVFTYIGRIVVKKSSLKYFKDKKNLRSLLLITTPDKAMEQIETVSNNTFSDFKIIGLGLITENGYKAEKSIINDIPIVALNNEISDYIKTNVVDEVMILVPSACNIVSEIESDCSKMGVVIHNVLNMPEVDYVRHEVENMGGYSVLTSSANFASTRQLFIKRAMDIVGSLVGLVITGILFLFVAPAIYIKSPGPIFFSQERIGLNGRRFKAYKFRSMYMDAEERKAALMDQNKMNGLMFKIDDDPRIIKGIGHFIRKTSIDEFPQMWNVLKGDMSLVGTRPPTVDEFMQYEYHHKSRLSTKPGITGMWQVSGRSNITDFEEVVALDNKYIENWNIGLDIKILLKTFLVVFQEEGSV